MAKGWLRQNALLLAGLGGELVFGLVLQKGWLDNVPDPLIGILCVIPLLLCIYGLWHLPSVQKFLSLLYNRNSKMLLILLIVGGAVLGSSIGLFAYWTIKRQNQRQDKPTAEVKTEASPTPLPSPIAPPVTTPTPTQEMENRAYVAVTAVLMENTVQSKKRIRIAIFVENTGKTPAVKYTPHLYVGFSPEEPTKPGYITTTGPPDVAVLPPGTEVTVEVVRELTEQEWKQVFDYPNSRLYAWGDLVYEDIFGKPHTTKFCFVNASRDSLYFNACSQGNEMD